jgi:ribulose bisphosphate carboxylase small subunit
MYRVDFENAFGKVRTINKVSTREDAFKAINKFLSDHNYKSYYTRIWFADDNKKKEIVDVGSHCEFFHIVKED